MVIPNLRGGRGVGLKIRRADPGDGAKYVMVSGSAKASFVLPGGSTAVAVVESELDAALILKEAGDLATALALGTAKGKPDADAGEGPAPGGSGDPGALDSDQAGAEAFPWWRKNFPPVGPVADARGERPRRLPQGRRQRPGLDRGRGFPAAPARQATPKRQTPPYPADYLARVAHEHPNLACCPRSTPAWSWRDKTACASCGECDHAA